MRADAGACGPKMRGHRLRNCTKDLILLAHSGEAQARKRRGLRRCLDGFSARSLTGRQGEGRTETRDGKKGTAPKGRALFVGPVFLNKKYVFCAFSQVAGATGGEAFLCAGVGGRRPSPPQRASTSCASPAPGGGGGREGEGARAAGGSAGGRRTRQQTGTARNRREPPRAGGGAAGAPPRGTAQGPPRGEWRAAPPRVGAGPTGGLQGLPRPPRSGPRAAPPGARAGDSGPPPTAGAAHAPHLVRPGADPRRGRARGRRGTERGPGRREPPQGGPAAAAPRRPAARSAIPKGRRPAKKESAQAIKARTLSQVTRGSTPCRVIVPQRCRCCQAPGGGGPPYLIIGHYSVTGGRRGPCGRGDVPSSSAGCTGHGTIA